MSLPKFAALGWELAEPRLGVSARPGSATDSAAPGSALGSATRIARLEESDFWNGEGWNSAEALFLSTSAIARLWSDLAAPSEGKPRKKASAVREQAAWERVANFARNLRRLLRRGGLLICRLDAPLAQQKIRFPPLSKCFPDGKAIDNYLALAVVHSALAEWSSPDELDAGEPQTIELSRAGSPWSAYLEHFQSVLAPAVSLPLAGCTSAVLARDARGGVIAAADSQVVLLPRLETPDPEREAELLIEAALEARSLQQASAPHAIPSEAAADIERLRRDERSLDEQIERLRRERETVRRALRQREQLGNLIASADASQFAAAVAQALAILGMTVRGAEGEGSPARSAGGHLVVEALPAGRGLKGTAASDAGESNYVVSGRLRRGSRGTPALEAAAAQTPSRKLRLIADSVVAADDAPEAAGQFDEETVVPARELFQAAMAVLASPEDETLRSRIRQSLHESSGVYRFAAS